MINEVLSDNEAGIVDENDQNEDWIELYNAGGTTQDLTGWGLYDSGGVEALWAFPEGTSIEPGAWLLVWADDDEDGPLHATFKIAKEGESLTLVDGSGETVDTVEVPALDPDAAYARESDGAASWTTTESPTPGSAN